MSEQTSPDSARLLKRLGRIEELPSADQRAVLKLVDAVLDIRCRSAPAHPSREPQGQAQTEARPLGPGFF